VFQGAFPSMAAKFAEEIVGPIFGQETAKITNLEIVRRGDHVTPMIFSTEPIERLAEEKNAYGFYVAILNDIWVTDPQPKVTHKISWRTGGRTYDSSVSIETVETSRPIIPQEDRPKYDELWRPPTDGAAPRLTGLVVFGSTLSDEADAIIQ